MSSNQIKAWAKPKGQDQGWEVGMAAVGGVVGGKWRQLYLNNDKKCGGENKTSVVMSNNVRFQALHRSLRIKR